MLKGLAGTLLLCVVSATASAQDSAQSQVQDLDGLLSTPVSTGAKYAQDIRQVSGSVSIVTAGGYPAVWLPHPGRRAPEYGGHLHVV